MNRIKTTLNEIDHDLVPVESQILGAQVVPLPLHGYRYNYQKGRQGELQEDQTAAYEAAAELRGFPGKGPNRIEPGHDLGGVKAREKRRLTRPGPERLSRLRRTATRTRAVDARLG